MLGKREMAMRTFVNDERVPDLAVTTDGMVDLRGKNLHSNLSDDSKSRFYIVSNQM